MRMKRRISLTIDPKIARKGRRVAKRRNLSLSSLVESLLSEATEDSKSDQSKVSFAERWGGRLQVEPHKSPRFSKLADKYDLK